MSNSRKHLDVIVIGLGSMGSSALLHLAQRGFKVLGIDQFTVPHELGSHTGESRIIRKAYFEHPNYVPLLKRSFELIKILEDKAEQQLYHPTGIAYFGHTEGDFLSGVKKSAELHKIPLEPWTTNKNHPFHKVDTKFSEKIFEPEAGYLKPGSLINATIQLAQASGAEMICQQKVEEWIKTDHGYEVKLKNESLFCKKLVICAGAFTSELVREKISLKITLQSQFWFKPKNIDQFGPSKFPCWFIHDPKHEGIFYGFPSLDNKTIKIAHHFPTDEILIEEWTPIVSEESLRAIHSFTKEYFNDSIDDLVFAKNCMYTMSKDEDFIIDFLSEENRDLVIAAGFSGHGFKFAPVVGEIIADLIEHEQCHLPYHFLKRRKT